MGVDVFFVISGFLISSIIFKSLKQGSFSYIDFYKKRINRIFPSLIVVLLAVLVTGWFSLFRNEFINLGKHIFGGAVFLSNILLLRESGYFDTAAEFKPLLHLWSLGVEEQFYITWPLFFLFLSKRRMSWMRGILFIVIISFALNILGAGSKPAATFFLPITRFWELLFGGSLAYVSVYKGNRISGVLSEHRGSFDNAKAAAGMFLLVVAILELNSETIFPGWWALFPTVGTYLLISAGQETWLSHRVLSSRPFIFVGKISYPLYLWHWPLLSFPRIVTGGPLSETMTASMVALAFPLAWLTYEYVEKPIRQHKSSGIVAILLFLGIVGIGTFGLMTYLGFPKSRLDTPAIDRINQAIGDREFPGGGGVAFDGTFILNKIPGTPDKAALFIGDSHIEQYWSRVKTVIADKNSRARTAIFATNAGCPPLPDVDRIQPGYSCDRYYRFAIDTAMRADVDTVIFGGYWESYFGLNYGEKNSKLLLYSTEDKSRSPIDLNSAATRKVFDEFQKDIQSLIRKGKTVYIILSNPASPDFDPKSMLPDRMNPGVFPGAKEVSRAGFTRRIAPVITELKAIAAATGAITIDPVEYLCDPVACRTASEDGLPIYKDTNHMRPDYVRKNAVYIDRMLITKQVPR